MITTKSSIRKKIQLFMLTIALVAVVLTSLVGVFGMFNIQKEAIRGGETIGNISADKSEEALLEQMKSNMERIVEGKSLYANAELKKYSDFVSGFAGFASGLYTSKELYNERPVDKPLAANKDLLSMQRTLKNESIALADVKEELYLLGNMEDVLYPVMSQYKEVFTTVYIGTESGFAVSYDRVAYDAASYMESEGLDEYYWDFTESEWYLDAKNRSDRGVFFTDAYEDSQGRGMTMSCICPIYESDTFVGAIGLDILVGDLNDAILNVDVSENSYAFLINADGDILSSAGGDAGITSITNQAMGHPAYEVRDRILSCENEVALTSGGIYYAYAPIECTGWIMVIHIPSADIIKPITDIRGDISDSTQKISSTITSNIVVTVVIFVLAFAAVTVAVVFASGSMAKKLAKPLVQLERDVEVISSGDLEYQSLVHTNDEIGQLAASFNGMTRSLKEHIEELTAVTAEKQRIGAELDVATKIQASMLPCIFPAFPEREEFDIHASMTPAKEVGGDFYDFFMVDENNLAIVVADVSGKGVPAALFMVIGKTLIKDHTVPGKDLGEVFTEVNTLLCEANSEELFITAFVGVLNLRSGEFRYVNAGHELPFISRDGKPFAPHKIRAAFVLAGMEGMKYKAGVFQLAPGDKIFQYTDGVTEATDRRNELFGMKRLEDSLAAVSDKAPAEILRRVKADIDAFVGEAPQFDDITMLCLEFKKHYGEGGDGMTVTDLTIDSVTALTAYLEETLEKEGAPLGVIAKMNIALDEIYSNIVKFSGADFAKVTCGVENGNTAYLILADNGKPYNPLEREDPDITLSAEEREIGGLGIFMVKKSMTSIAYEYAGGTNNLTMKLTF